MTYISISMTSAPVHHGNAPAAHIIPDLEEGGEPLVTSGPALCKPHPLQGLHGASIQLPRRAAHRPDRERLELRHRRFLEAGR